MPGAASRLLLVIIYIPAHDLGATLRPHITDYLSYDTGVRGGKCDVTGIKGFNLGN